MELEKIEFISGTIRLYMNDIENGMTRIVELSAEEFFDKIASAFPERAGEAT
jgi:hypothetical protein